MVNEIVFLVVILQLLFFDMNVEDVVNYGGIGVVIGYEIGYGFDDFGLIFDGDGVFCNWWIDLDLSEFKVCIVILVNQYNEFEVLFDLYVNGEYMLGENIGDLGGISIVFKVYYFLLQGEDVFVLDGFLGD